MLRYGTVHQKFFSTSKRHLSTKVPSTLKAKRPPIQYTELEVDDEEYAYFGEDEQLQKDTLVDVFLCESGKEKLLQKELKTFDLPQKLEVRNGMIESTMTRHPRRDDVLQNTVWTRQVIPNATKLNGSSINQLAKGCAEHVIPIFKGQQEASSKPIRWTTSIVEPVYPELSGRSKILKSEILNNVKDMRRKVYRELADPKDVVPGDFLCQILLADKETVYIGLNPLGFSSHWGWNRPFPFNPSVILHDSTAPSRAYSKLLEILNLLQYPNMPASPLTSEDIVVELGSAPGGWTKVLLDREVRVISVDRVPLDESVNSHKNAENLRHVIGNGTSFLPPKPVDWVLNDMAVSPEKSLNTLRKWIEGRHARKFIWTLKFTGDDYRAVQDAKELLTSYGCEFAFRNLTNHGNELCMIGTISK